MRQILLTLTCLFWFANAFGQTTELTVSLNSGLFSFAGRSASSSSFLNYTPGHGGYTNNPYGSDPGLSYGLSLGIKRVVRRHLLVGVDAGYEVLRSVVHLSWVSEAGTATSYSLPAHGQTILVSHFINVEPYVGFRVTPGRLTVDLTGGLDLAHCLSTREKGKAKGDNGTTYQTSVNRITITNDVRPRGQLTVGYRKTALYAGYSLGLRNYMGGYVGGPVPQAYGRLFRFGVQYRLR